MAAKTVLILHPPITIRIVDRHWQWVCFLLDYFCRPGMVHFVWPILLVIRSMYWIPQFLSQTLHHSKAYGSRYFSPHLINITYTDRIMVHACILLSKCDDFLEYIILDKRAHWILYFRKPPKKTRVSMITHFCIFVPMTFPPPKKKSA